MGFRFFSVGDGAGAEVVVVVVVEDGVGVVVLEQPTASAPIATIAAPPAIAGRRRVKRPVFIVLSYLIRNSPRGKLADLGGWYLNVNIMPYTEQTSRANLR